MGAQHATVCRKLILINVIIVVALIAAMTPSGSGPRSINAQAPPEWGEPPPICGPGIPSGCMYQGDGIGMEVTPHVARIGQTITVRFFRTGYEGQFVVQRFLDGLWYIPVSHPQVRLLDGDCSFGTEPPDASAREAEGFICTYPASRTGSLPGCSAEAGPL